MTGETERQPSSWTVDSLKVLEDEKIAALERLFGAELKRLEVIILGQDRAVTLLGNANEIAQNKFEATVKDGFVKQNEFRGSLDDLGKTMATRRELEAFMEEYRRAHAEVVNGIGDLRSRLDVGPVGLSTLANQQAIQQGRQQGVQVVTNNLLFAAAAFAGIVGALVGHFIH